MSCARASASTIATRYCTNIGSTASPAILTTRVMTTRFTTPLWARRRWRWIGRGRGRDPARHHRHRRRCRLGWLDGRPLLSTIEPYRRQIFNDVLFTFDPDMRPRYDRYLGGRAKKNWKTADLILAALYRFLAWESPAGNDSFILANDE